MPIAAADLILFGAASRPLDDVSLAGGAIDLTMRPVFTQLSAPARLAMISDGADTRNVTITGRTAAGAYTSEVVALTGAVEVLSVATFERILSVTAASTSATRTITIKQGSGGVTIATIPVNEAGVYAMFIKSASAVGSVTRYEKTFWRNINGGGIVLNAAQVTLTSDPAARILIGLSTTKDDTATVANRLAAPAGVAFVDDNIAINVPGTTLEAGSAIGTWIQQALQAADAPFKTTFTTQLSGTTI